MEVTPSARSRSYAFKSMDIDVDAKLAAYFASKGLPGRFGESVRFEGVRNRLGRILECSVVVGDVSVHIDTHVAAATLLEHRDFMALDERATAWRANTPGAVGRASFVATLEAASEPVPSPEVIPRPAERRAATDPRPLPTRSVPRFGVLDPGSDADRLRSALKDNHLMMYEKAFANAGIDTIEYLVEHSTGQLQESLARPHVFKKSFVFSLMERQSLIRLGLFDDLPLPAFPGARTSATVDGMSDTGVAEAGVVAKAMDAAFVAGAAEAEARKAEAAAEARLKRASEAEAAAEARKAKHVSDAMRAVAEAAGSSAPVGLVEVGAAYERAMAEAAGRPAEDGPVGLPPVPPLSPPVSPPSVPGVAGRAPSGHADLFDGLKMAATVFRGVPIDDLDTETVDKMCKSVRKAVDPAADPAADASSSLAEAIDVLDTYLTVGASRKLWSLSDLAPAGSPSMRSSKRHLLSVCVSASTGGALPTSEVEPKASESMSSASLGLMAGALLDAGKGTMSASDLKIADELTASAARLNEVCADPKSRANLMALEKVMLSSESAEKKIEEWHRVVENDAKARPLLYSTFVRPPQGAQAMSNPHALEVVRCQRTVANAFRTACEDVLAAVLPHDADANMLVTCVFNGELSGEKFSLKAISEAKSKGATALLGSAAPSTSPAGKGRDNELVITLAQSMNSLSFAIQLIHRHDTTAPMALATVMSSVYTGLKRNGTAVAVERILDPLFRSYQKAWKLFQSSQATEFPVFQVIWDKEKVKAQICTYLMASVMPSLVGSPAGEPGEPSPPGQGKRAQEKAKKEAEAEKVKLAKLTKDLAEAKKELKAMSDADDDDAEPSKAAEKRARQKATREKKDAELAAFKAKEAKESKP